MGLFKMFGAGGGTLDVILDSPQFAAGTSISGVAKFIGGKRDQVIDDLFLSIDCTLYATEQTPQGPRETSTTQQIVPRTSLASGVTSQAGGTLEFRFSYPLNPDVYTSQAGVVEYRLHASADIDGEVDPGDAETFTVVGGAHYDPGAQKVTGHVVGRVQVGEKVVAKWTDGNWYAGKVTNIQDGYYGVDWDDHKLGASSWVAPADVRQAAAGAPVQTASAPTVGAHVVAKWTNGNFYPGIISDVRDGYYGVDWTDPKLGASSWVLPADIQAPAVKQQPMAAKAQALAAKAAAMPMQGGAYNKGQAVWAQFTDGSWQPATYSELKDGWHGVDWVDAKLGQSSWVQATQVKPR